MKYINPYSFIEVIRGGWFGLMHYGFADYSSISQIINYFRSFPSLFDVDGGSSTGAPEGPAANIYWLMYQSIYNLHTVSSLEMDIERYRLQIEGLKKSHPTLWCWKE